MQFRRQLFVMSFATIILAAACQNPSLKTVRTLLFATYQHKTVNDSHFIQPTQSNGLEAGVDREHFEGIREVLSMIETGRMTLHLIEKYEIGLNFEPGKGSCFYPHRNEIVIDSKVDTSDEG